MATDAPVQMNATRILHRPTVIVVDDDPDIIELVSAILATEGYVTQGCARGQDVLDHFRPFAYKACPPTIVLLDYLMPGMNGDVVMSYLEQWRLRPLVKVILFSASTHVSDVVKARADGFLAKPFDIDELVARVEQCWKVEVSP